jgi:predicted alpha/beta hydrolase family esterase
MKRVIAAQHGPVVLVGHSYGGVVITQGGNDRKVAGLVYIAAFAPAARAAVHVERTRSRSITGHLLGLSVVTVEREWQAARAWLYSLTGGHHVDA